MSLVSATSAIMAQINLKMGPASDINPLYMVKKVDIFNDQITRLVEGEEFPFEFNCILVEVADAQWEDTSMGEQQGDVIFRFHVGMNILADEQKFNYLVMLDELHKVIHGFKGLKFNSLSRIRTNYDINHGNINVHTVEYICKVWDIEARKPTTDIEDVNLENTVDNKPPENFPDPKPYVIP